MKLKKLMSGCWRGSWTKVFTWLSCFVSTRSAIISGMMVREVDPGESAWSGRLSLRALRKTKALLSLFFFSLSPTDDDDCPECDDILEELEKIDGEVDQFGTYEMNYTKNHVNPFFN